MIVLHELDPNYDCIAHLDPNYGCIVIVLLVLDLNSIMHYFVEPPGLLQADTGNMLQ